MFMLGNICWNALSCVLHNWSDGINLPLSGKQQGPNTKMVFLVIRIHYEYKIVMRPSYLYKGNHYTARQHLYIERAPRETTRVCPNIKTVFPVIRMSIMKIIWLWDHLIIIGGIPPLVREYLYIERAPDCQHLYHFYHGVFSCCIETWRKKWLKFADYFFKCILLSENCIFILISLRYVLKGLIGNKSALVQVMAWHRKGDKLWHESIMTQFFNPYTHHQDHQA